MIREDLFGLGLLCLLVSVVVVDFGDERLVKTMRSVLCVVRRMMTRLCDAFFRPAINNDIRHLVEEFVIAFQRFNENFHNILDDDDDAEDRE